MNFLNYLIASWPEILHLLIQHIELAGITATLATLVGIPLGIMMARYQWLADTMMFAATIVLTIPSIALLGLMVPVIGIGACPAVIAVLLYSLLPIMRNTYLALSSIEHHVKEAAIGIGMTFWQRLRLVDFPLSIPVIMGGVRTAVVMSISIMTAGAVISSGGLGALMFDAINQSNMPKLIVGSVMISTLAILADMLLKTLQRLLISRGIQK
jgi:osmoprotectant transport system permease protein